MTHMLDSQRLHPTANQPSRDGLSGSLCRIRSRMKLLLIAIATLTALTAAEPDWITAQGGSRSPRQRRTHHRSVASPHLGHRQRRRTPGRDPHAHPARPFLTYVSDRGIEKLQKLDKLEDLNLDTAEFITDAATSFLRSNKKLRRLNLRGTDVTDTSLAYLAELTALRALDISQTQITDVGLEHLASLVDLEDLDLGGDKISGVSLNTLKLLPKLKKLGFYGIQRRNAGLCWAPVVTDKELETISLLTNLEDLNIGWGVGLGKAKAGPSVRRRSGVQDRRRDSRHRYRTVQRRQAEKSCAASTSAARKSPPPD